jgi:hypothetical protein
MEQDLDAIGQLLTKVAASTQSQFPFKSYLLPNDHACMLKKACCVIFHAVPGLGARRSKTGNGRLGAELSICGAESAILASEIYSKTHFLCECGTSCTSEACQKLIKK